MRNIVFDLGGVLFARDINKHTREFHEFFAFVRREPMPAFWDEYDRGTNTFDAVTATLAELNACPTEVARERLLQAIATQEPVAATVALLVDLKQAGYKLYVLSNMAREFIAHLRRFPVYRLFDGEVVSCEEHTVKPERRIYEILLERYGLDAHQTLFVDDRVANLHTAEALGIHTRLFDYRDPEGSCAALRRELL